MTFSIPISEGLLVQEVFVFLAVFSRLSAMVMTFPALGSQTVPQNIRLILALALTLIVTPLVVITYPQMPVSLFGLVLFIGAEVLIGLVIGGIVRLVMSGVQTAGTLIAFQSGLAFAQNYDPTQGVQGALLGTFLSVLAVTFIFATDLHHLLIAALHDSYILFPAGGQWPWERFIELAVSTVAGSFVIAVQLAAPFLIFGLVFYLGIGILSKLMPQVQIFFIAMPANILLGFIILMLVLSTMMIWFSDYFTNVLETFLV